MTAAHVPSAVDNVSGKQIGPEAPKCCSDATGDVVRTDRTGMRVGRGDHSLPTPLAATRSP